MTAAADDRRTGRKTQRPIERERAARESRLVFELVPPEGVPIRFAVAGLGARIAAQVADLLLSVLAVAAAMILLSVTVGGVGTLATATLLFFAVRTPYYVAAELLWNGQTLGKQMTRLRVISADGRGLTTHAVVVRNLMKEAEVFVPGTFLVMGASDSLTGQLVVLAWIGVLVAIPRFNRRRQRIGDMIADTVVVMQPQALLMPDLTAGRSRARDRFVFDAGQLDHYGRYELQTLEKVLQSETRGTAATREQRRANLTTIAKTIRTKIGYHEPVSDDDAVAFLRAFYAAQRAYLEQRQLFGETREDKFHRGDPGRPPEPPGSR